jgi:hypothetical protein
MKPVHATAILALLSGSTAAFGAAKPPANPSCNPNPGITTPVPVRQAVLTSVGTTPFSLPNGSTVNLGADLQALLATAVTSSGAFSPTDPALPGQTDPCDTHLEIRAAVSTLELNATTIGVSFGYTPSGATSTVTNVNGSVAVSIGTIAMDFGIWECVSGRCSEVAASTASQATAGVNLNLTIDFSSVTTSPSLIYNTPLGDAIRAIMNNGMKTLAGSPNLAQLSWTATVKQWEAGPGLLIFDAGTNVSLAPNQAFVIYAPAPSTGACGVFQAVANAHTTAVTTVSSTALVDQVLDPLGVQVGDVVMVRAVGSAQ